MKLKVQFLDPSKKGSEGDDAQTSRLNAPEAHKFAALISTKY
jgi:hypothetical protein